MDFLVSLKQFLWQNFVATSLYWPFLIATLALVFFLYLFQTKADVTTKQSFYTWILPRNVIKHRSSRLDLSFFVINLFLYGLLFSTWTVSTSEIAALTVEACEIVFGSVSTIPNGYLIPSVILTIAIFLALDLGFFIAHILQHKIPWLWRFHRVHHSAEVLNPLTAFRQHPFDQLFEGLVVGVITGLVVGGFEYYFLGLAAPYSIMGFNSVIFAFYLAGVHLRHSHIRLGYPGWLSRILISPEQHQFHHSRNPDHFNKNFGGFIAFWDWTFGSLFIPKSNDELQVGVSESEVDAPLTVLDLYLLPFKLKKTVTNDQ